MAIFTGSGVAIITPFHEDGSINYDQLKKLVDYHCENGTDSIVICGTTGESATMTEEEHLECIKRTIDFTAGRIPVIAGTGIKLYCNSGRAVQRGCKSRSRWPSCCNSVLQ